MWGLTRHATLPSPDVSLGSVLCGISNQLERVKEIAQEACAAADKADEEVTELNSRSGLATS